MSTPAQPDWHDGHQVIKHLRTRCATCGEQIDVPIVRSTSRIGGALVISMGSDTYDYEAHQLTHEVHP
ncbi:hypothetical protein [Nakamurella lactea]|uniref:hypothetical protein n=1 Tax=Nakamurella lactea TaxID=459515 RepID=UPI00048AF1AA|nr:hypothetical protein [Nakamurella lactea]